MCQKLGSAGGRRRGGNHKSILSYALFDTCSFAYILEETVIGSGHTSEPATHPTRRPLAMMRMMMSSLAGGDSINLRPSIQDAAAAGAVISMPGYHPLIVFYTLVVCVRLVG